MIINNNLPALSAYNNLNSTNNALNKSLQELSTGLRINSSSDDAASSAVSEKIRAQVSGLDTAIRNSQDGMSLLHTAEGALSQTNSMLVRMRELSVQAANDSLTSQDRQYMQLEIDQLKDQITRIADTTEFNKMKILDGSSGAIWSSNDLNVNAKINSGLNYTDSSGQKVSSEGNYRIEVKASPGEAQVQKSNILDIKTSINELPYEININSGKGSLDAVSGDGWNFSNGILTITENGTYSITGDSTETSNRIVISSGVNANIYLKDVNINSSVCAFNMTGAEVNLYLENDNVLKTTSAHRSALEVPSGATLTISSAEGDYSESGTLTASGGVHGAGIGGACGGKSKSAGDITINGGTVNATGGQYAAGIGGGWLNGTCGNITINGGNITATGGAGAAGIGSSALEGAATEKANSGSITINGGTITANGGAKDSTIGQGAGIGGGSPYAGGNIMINSSASVTTTGYIPAGANESIGSGEYASSANISYTSGNTLPDSGTLPDKPTYEDPIAGEVHTLADIGNFYNISGVFMLTQPQVITVTQGDGKTASVTLYSTDTIYSAAQKINNLISKTFGNANNTDNPEKFCTVSDGTEGTSESVYASEDIYDDEGRLTGHNIHATMLIRSAIPGKAGELYFSGDEEFLNALGLNTIHESSETTYTASVYDAHTGKRINEMKAEGSEFPSIIPPEIDIQVDPMTGLVANWDEQTKKFIFAGNDSYSAVIHLKNNAITFQTGANSGEDFMIQLGNMSSNALGITGVNVLTRETASRAISVIDNAINKISSQRAKIGAYTNSLENTLNSLTITSANLTETDSRIRDADIPQAMMNFVKLQILNQSGTSMLAQANQTPQSVLSLMQ